MGQFFMLGGLNNDVIKSDVVKPTKPTESANPAKVKKPVKPTNQAKQAPIVKKDLKSKQTDKKPAVETRPALKTLVTEYLKNASGPVSIKDMKETLFAKWGEWSDASFKSAMKDSSLFKKSGDGMIELVTNCSDAKESSGTNAETFD